VYLSPNVTQVIRLRKMKWAGNIACKRTTSKPQNLRGINFLKDQVWVKGKYLRYIVKRVLTEFSCS
jgi:hypothetical protein